MFSSQAAEISSIDFKVDGNQSQIEIVGDGPLTYTKQTDAQPGQIVLDVAAATLAGSASRKLDTSSFASPVTLISPYEVDSESGPQARIVIQLKENMKAEAVTPLITQEGNAIKIVMTAPSSDAVAASDEEAPMDEAPVSEEVVSEASPEKDKIDQFLAAQKSKKFSGSPITLQVRDADIRDVLRLVSESSGFNIVIADQVVGKISLSLLDVPWDQVLDVVLHTLKLGAERSYNVLRVVTLKGMAQEKEQEVAAKLAQANAAPRVTKVFPISYADPAELLVHLQSFGTDGTSGTESTTTTVRVDTRTNSIIVRDLPDNLERMEKLIKILDTQTPQVVIEAKVVEVTENFSNSIAGSLGMGMAAISANDDGSNPTQAGTSFNGAGPGGGNPFDDLVGGIYADGAAVSADSATGGLMMFSPHIGILGGIRINALLALGEGESQVKVVSSPKTVVANKQTASIVASQPVAFQTGSIETGNILLDATVSLKVTPTVTNDENVVLEVSLERGVPQTLSGGLGGAVANRTLETLVVVESGSTLVIGGLYNNEHSESETGFPILRKLPVIGWLFGSESKTTSRSELFMFITPRILNPKKAGLS